MAKRICGVPHPKYASYVCQKAPNQEGNHVGRRGKISRHWAPYLPLFNQLTKGGG